MPDSRLLPALVAPALIFILIGPAPSSAQTGLKVHISADMEGITGVVTDAQLGPSGFEYQRFREQMTREVLAAIQGARDAGATRFVIADSHGNGQNLLIEQLPDDAAIVRSWPRALGMMAGIDETVDAAVYVGYHASTTSPAGVRAHTLSSATLAGVSLNGVAMSEGTLNAAIAGHFGVPVVAMTGDDVAIEEVRAVIGDIEGAVVKQALGFHSALTLHPTAALSRIREAVRDGLTRRAALPPYRVEAPITLEVRFKNYLPAEVLAYLPIVERVDAHAVRFVGRDMTEVSRFLTFVTNYEPGLAP